MNYTAGEWEVTRWASHNDIHVSAKDTWGNYVFVANCGNPKPDSLPTNENAEDNAHLISAAVEMYENLKALLMVVPPHYIDEQGARMLRIPKALFVSMKHSVAKAEGKQ